VSNLSLRPLTLADFHGQPELTHDLEIIIQASLGRGDYPDHMLFSGPPGLGKTTISHIIAHELSLPVMQTTGPAIEKPGDLASLLTSLKEPTVLFIDEIHALDRRCEELLYSAMEDGYIDLIVGEGARARSIKINLEKFVLVAATTLSGNLSGPLRDRFGYHGRFKLYDEQTLASIVMRSSGLLKIEIGVASALTIAKSSRGTPRIANRLLRRVRDYLQIHPQPELAIEIQVQNALDSYGIDNLGLDSLGRDILKVLIQNFNGGPVGLQTLAAAVGESSQTIEELYEPYFMRVGLLQRTLRGRLATPLAYLHLGLEPMINTNLATGQNLDNQPQLDF